MNWAACSCCHSGSWARRNPGCMGIRSLGSMRMWAPRRGFEPLTLRLTAACSTVELPRNGVVGAVICRYRTRATTGCSIHCISSSVKIGLEPCSTTPNRASIGSENSTARLCWKRHVRLALERATKCVSHSPEPTSSLGRRLAECSGAVIRRDRDRKAPSSSLEDEGASLMRTPYARTRATGRGCRCWGGAGARRVNQRNQ
jgi:hypothetical protein